MSLLKAILQAVSCVVDPDPKLFAYAETEPDPKIISDPNLF
jgi:hypothetical protein